MDRNGKKPKATHDDAAHPERSDTKAHILHETESSETECVFHEPGSVESHPQSSMPRRARPHHGVLSMRHPAP